MSGQTLPRFFVASERGSQPSAPEDAQIEHCADSFRLSGGATASEVVVGVNRLGELTYTLGSGSLSARAQRERNVHEALCMSEQRAHARVVRAERLYLFEMAFLEQLEGGSELNQPVHAFGTLIGPIDAAGSSRVRGQLTLTRADLLEGFSLGKGHAFRYGDEGGRARACHHALLPGALAEEMAQGRDLVLAYALPPSELGEEDLENGAIVQLLIGELVEALRRDLAQREAARGMLGRWFGGSRAAQLVRDETLDPARSLALAERALACIPQWPSGRALALRARSVVEAPAKQLTPGSPGAVVSTAQQTKQARKPAVSGAQFKPQGKSNTTWKKPTQTPPDWTRDFLPQQHRDQDRSRYLAWRPPAIAKKRAESRDWMDDFRPRTEHTEADTKEKATRPDWMRDFEDE